MIKQRAFHVIHLFFRAHISFDDHVGHDYFGDADARYEFYHRKEDKIEFDLQIKKITFS